MSRFTVAVDGPAAAGKGTIARQIADQFGLAFLDTGLLYRAVAKKMLDAGRCADARHAVSVAATLSLDDLEQPGLRTREVSAESSRIAAMPEVRAVLVDFQRQFARRPEGAVLDGRDIGTVICPDAEVKLFVTARDDVRAERRHRELASHGVTVSRREILQDLQDRDARDRERQCAALSMARDAVLINTSNLTIDEAAKEAVAAVLRKVHPVEA